MGMQECTHKPFWSQTKYVHRNNQITIIAYVDFDQQSDARTARNARSALQFASCFQYRLQWSGLSTIQIIIAHKCHLSRQ